MAKLTVRKVGPIREAEIEVKKHTVFIGPQGTGKSTLAKLIAIGGDRKLSDPSGHDIASLITKFSLNSFINDDLTRWNFQTNSYKYSSTNSLSYFEKAILSCWNASPVTKPGWRSSMTKNNLMYFS